jgi:hypothetical protein
MVTAFSAITLPNYNIALVFENFGTSDGQI